LVQEEEEDRGGVRVAVSRYVQRKAAQKKAGVYAIYNGSGEAQYIGFARSILAAVKVASGIILKYLSSQKRQRVSISSKSGLHKLRGVGSVRSFPALVALCGTKEPAKLGMKLLVGFKGNFQFLPVLPAPTIRKLHKSMVDSL
jgi:hypothetical protein